MKFTDLLFPPCCPCCGGPLSEGETVCSDCAETIHYNESPHCPFCGVSLKDCRCRKQARAFDRVVAPFYYHGAVRDAIRRMKFGKREEVARFLAKEMKKEIEARCFGEDFDFLTAVPMSRNRLVSRGFNQAQTLAEFLLKSPPTCLEHAVFDRGLLKQIPGKDSAMQHLLGAEARRQNIRNSLRVGADRDLVGKRILLVDDIVTTGATVEECASILRLAGAERVCVAAAAVTPPKENVDGNTIQEARKRLEL